MKPEWLKSAQIVNRSGRSIEQVVNWFPRDLSAAKVTLMPELNPGRSPLPTGCRIEIDEDAVPGWRSLAVSDVGCGMQVLAGTLTWSDFDASRHLWNDLYRLMKHNPSQLGQLGSGNHFLDAAVAPDTEKVHFVIHTGSRHESVIPQTVVAHPDKFDIVYHRAVDWARRNRDAVRRMIEEVYGPTRLILDQPHNFFSREDGKVRINKGTVTLRPGELSVIPSSMEGEMALVRGTGKLAETNYTVPHGTGRRKSRSEGKQDAAGYDFAGLRQRLIIPSGIRDESLAGEIPVHYRSLDECLEMLGDTVEVVNRLLPIAYLGQIKPDRRP